MPAATRQSVLTFVSPDLRDLLFWEHVTFSRVDHTALVADPKWAYGTAHPVTTKYPNHELVYLEHDPNFDAGADGQDAHRYKAYYAAERSDQDNYNFEHVTADIGGQKFNAVRRTYVIKRTDFDENLPLPGAAMPRHPQLSLAPTWRFPTGYILAGRQQQRIGQRELDALYVVETRTYVERSTIRSAQTDQATGGVVLTKSDLYYRGETYTPIVTGGLPSAIEVAAVTPGSWGLTNTGQNTEVTQLSDNWWEVRTQDVIPQNLGGPSGYGILLRTYETWQDFSWPAVVQGGDLVFTSIPRKNGSSTTTVVVYPTRPAYRGATKMTINQYWSRTAKTLGTPYKFDTQDATYSGAQYAVAIRNSIIKGNISLTDTIGTLDPVFKLGAYGPAPWALTSDPNDWPNAAAIVSVTQQPFRGGFLITTTAATPPEPGTYAYTHTIP